jgi:hypothetical protein
MLSRPSISSSILFLVAGVLTGQQREAKSTGKGRNEWCCLQHWPSLSFVFPIFFSPSTSTHHHQFSPLLPKTCYASYFWRSTASYASIIHSTSTLNHPHCSSLLLVGHHIHSGFHNRHLTACRTDLVCFTASAVTSLAIIPLTESSWYVYDPQSSQRWCTTANLD